MLKLLIRSYDDVMSLFQSHQLCNRGCQTFLGNPLLVFYGKSNNGGNRFQESNFTSKGRGLSQSGQTTPTQTPGSDSKDKSTMPYSNQVGKSVLTNQICDKHGHDAVKC